MRSGVIGRLDRTLFDGLVVTGCTEGEKFADARRRYFDSA
jgi:hypothetical protein